jgi:GT2 family glycosyltransferase
MKQKDYYHCLDEPINKKFQLTGRLIFVRGWFFDSNGNPAKRVIVRVGNNTIECSSFLRRDVQETFKNELEVGSNSGFRGWIKVGKGLKKLEIFAEAEDGKIILIAKRFIYATKNVSSLNLEDVNNSEEALNYLKWVNKYDKIQEHDLEKIREKTKNLAYKPLISIVLPTYNTNPKFLRKVIDSVLAQIYENWELCVADDASTEPHMKKILTEYSKADKRIKVTFRKENGHISNASNSCLEMISGEYTTLLDHDDLLTTDALACVVHKINQFPDAQLIYTDEDKISTKDHRTNPYFKPDWNYDLLLSHNFVCHLATYRTETLKKTGGFRDECVGAQDWDLVFRYIELIDEKTIHHIPHVLYHWRISDTSTAQCIETKPYAINSGKKVLNDLLERNHINGEVIEGKWRGSLRIKYHYDNYPKVSIIIPTRNRVELLRMCLDSICKHTKSVEYEIIVIDNDSDDSETLEYFESIKSDNRFKILKVSGEFNFSKLNNLAVQEAANEYILFLNNDIEVKDYDWLREMLSQCMREGVGAVGARLMFPQGYVQHAGVVIGIGSVAGHIYKNFSAEDLGMQGRCCISQSYSAVTAACLLTKKSIFEEIGGFNETDLKVAFNDIDLCLRIKELGKRIIYTPYAELIHHESMSRGYEDTEEKIKRFRKEEEYMRNRWGDYIEHDPAYNPNLTLEHEDGRYARPRVKKFWQI